jgi:hypothetical protein
MEAWVAGSRTNLVVTLLSLTLQGWGNVGAAIQGLAAALGVPALVITLLMLIRQTKAQTEATQEQIEENKRQQEVLSFEVYQRLTERYSSHLALASQEPLYHRLYEPLREARKDELDDAQRANPPWGAWEIMDDDEKKCFRYTRIALEICEQAYQVWRRGWIDDVTWAKWQTWARTFARTSYMPYVLDVNQPESRGRFHEGFIQYLEQTVDLPVVASAC